MNEIMDCEACMIEETVGDLQELVLNDFYREVELDRVIMERIAHNVPNLNKLVISEMSHCTEQTRFALAYMAKELILKNAPLKDLRLVSTGFSTEDAESIFRAIISSNSNTLEYIQLKDNEGWLDPGTNTLALIF